MSEKGAAGAAGGVRAGRSLRWRLLALQAVAIALALLLTGLALSLLFERHIIRRIEGELDAHLQRLAAAVSFDERGALQVSNPPRDERFRRIFSGLYWQVEEPASGALVHSRSLWDERLRLPELPLPAAAREVRSLRIIGPNGERLLVRSRVLIFRHAGRDRVVRLAVGIDLAEARRLTASFRKDLVITLLVLAVFLLLAAWLQTQLGLRPLTAIRRAIAAIRDGRSRRLSLRLPGEVAPLGEELNALLEHQEEEMRRARQRAADLAHGLRTPLAALKADAARLKRLGQDELARGIEETVVAMQRQVEHQLTAARPRHRGAVADVELVARGLVATLERTPKGSLVDIRVRGVEGMRVAMEAEDLADILGNLLENAVRHARERVLLVVSREGGRARFCVEDDGPGIASERTREALQRGVRLDERGGGAAGLGLSIVQQLLQAHDGTLELKRGEELGGLAACFSLRLARR